MEKHKESDGKSVNLSNCPESCKGFTSRALIDKELKLTNTIEQNEEIYIALLETDLSKSE